MDQSSKAIVAALSAGLVVAGCAWKIPVVIAQASGWAALSARYASDASMEERIYSWQTARFGKVALYRCCLWVSISPRGVMLRTFHFLKRSHPPLCIPWSDIRRTSGSTLAQVRDGFELGGSDGFGFFPLNPEIVVEAVRQGYVR